MMDTFWIVFCVGVGVVLGGLAMAMNITSDCEALEAFRIAGTKYECVLAEKG